VKEAGGDSPLEAELWSFAVALYGRPGVSESCLELQDVLGVDVVVLLTGLFAVTKGFSFDEDAIASADALVRSWREDVVVPLRTVRRYLKTRPLTGLAEATERLRQDIKRAELEAERTEFAALAAGVWQLTRSEGASASAAQTLQVIARHFGGAAPSGERAHIVSRVAKVIEGAMGEMFAEGWSAQMRG
jgi:uncharacterized protein (TIGR02444 family)